MSYACAYDMPADEQVLPEGARRRAAAHRVWESKRDWERFREDRVGPTLDKVFAASGLARPPPRPVEEEMDVVDVWTGA